MNLDSLKIKIPVDLKKTTFSTEKIPGRDMILYSMLHMYAELYTHNLDQYVMTVSTI